MQNNLPKKNSNRVEKVNSLIQHIVAQKLLDYKEQIKGVVTVQKVEASRDLRWAKVWITIVSNPQDDANDEKILAFLKNQLYDIQGELNRSLEMKIVPRISFYLDTSGRYAQHINEIFKEIEDERKNSGSDSEPAE